MVSMRIALMDGVAVPFPNMSRIESSPAKGNNKFEITDTQHDLNIVSLPLHYLSVF